MLPFDFAVFIGDKILLIEYQGEQHYKSLEYFGWSEKLKDRQQKDRIKRQHCVKKGILLIEVPYYEKNIEKLLDNAIPSKTS